MNIALYYIHYILAYGIATKGERKWNRVDVVSDFSNNEG